VRVNRRPVDKPGLRVKPGDVLTIALGAAEERPDGSLGGTIRVIRIAALAERRGPAPEARLLYEDLPD
jgi:ribosome-associated heat shock protein Hsp15